MYTRSMDSTIRRGRALAGLAGAGLVVLAAFATACTEGRGRPAQPNVVFIVMDTVRADHTSLCGYDRPTTPNLRKLAADGATYTCDAYAPGSWTLPSHASFFTGVDVATHGVDFTDPGSHEGTPLFEPDNLVNPLGPELPTLAEKLRKRGYATALVSANPIIRPAMGLTRGFETVKTADQFGELYRENLAPAVGAVLKAHEAHPGRPLFLFVNITDTHTPWYDVPSGVGWVSPQQGLRDYFTGGDKAPWVEFVTGALDPPARKRFLQRVTDLYDWALHQADVNLGAVLAELERHGLTRSPLRLVVTSDHGEFLGEHGLLDHGHYLYEPNNRVPFLYRETGRQVTLPDPMSGLNAFDLVLGDDSRLSSTPVLAFAAPGPRWIHRSGGRVGKSNCVALWTHDRKLLWMDGKVSKYDLRTDPGELSPLSADGDPLLPVIEDAAKRFAARTSTAPMSKEMLDRLRSVGYVQ